MLVNYKHEGMRPLFTLTLGTPVALLISPSPFICQQRVLKTFPLPNVPHFGNGEVGRVTPFSAYCISDHRISDQKVRTVMVRAIVRVRVRVGLWLGFGLELRLGLGLEMR